MRRWVWCGTVDGAHDWNGQDMDRQGTPRGRLGRVKGYWRFSILACILGLIPWEAAFQMHGFSFFFL